MTILVTGGAGFIGSHLCQALLEQGHKVTCVDNFITSTKDNLSHLLGNENFEFIEHSLTKPSAFSRRRSIALATERLQPSAIFHLASPASPVDYSKYPIETMLVNSVGTYNMLELAKKYKAKFLLASTSEVYGDPKEHPQKESYFGNVNPVGPRSQYDESKRFAEALTMSYFRKYGLEVSIARIFNTFGPRMRKEDGRAVPNFIQQAIRGVPLTVYGDGTQTRSFCYIDDMVEGLIKTMFSAAAGEIINLGNPEEMTVLALAEEIKKLSNSQAQIKFLPLPEDDPIRRQPNISKAKEVLGWEPQTSLKEGLGKTVQWFRETLVKERV